MTVPETAKTHVYRHIVDFPVEQDVLDELVAPGTTVLDIGTGSTGRSALGARANGGVVTSIEINVEAIADFGLGDVRQGIGLAAADMMSLPFSDASFDVVQVSLHGMDYVLDPVDRTAVFAEIYRVLKPGGSLSFNSFNPIGLALAPRHFLSLQFLKAKIRYILERRFLHPTMIDFNGIELHQATVRAVVNEAGAAGFSARSVRNQSGKNTNPWIVGLFSTAPHYVFDVTDS